MAEPSPIIGSHIVAMARYLVGPCARSLRRVGNHHSGATGDSGIGTAGVPSWSTIAAHAILRFENGAIGAIEANWAATGRTMDLSFEVTGTTGAIRFSQEQMNELHVWTSGCSRAGFTRIEAGPEHPPYGRFCPAPGHQIGFNDLKVIEVSRFLEAIAGGAPAYPCFRDALGIQRVIDGIRDSAANGRWTPIDGGA